MLGKMIVTTAVAAMAASAIPAKVSADGRSFYQRWDHRGHGIIAVTTYAPYYAPYSFYNDFDMRDLERYYDRSRYLDSCFVDRGTWTPFGLSVTQINTCYH